jgi:hypothetical protein
MPGRALLLGQGPSLAMLILLLPGTLGSFSLVTCLTSRLVNGS